MIAAIGSNVLAGEEITVELNTPNGPIVEYGPEHDAQEVESALPVGWEVDWETSAYKLNSGRYRRPICKAVPRGHTCCP